MDYQRPVKPSPPQTCAECSFIKDCGGLEGDAFGKGCFQRCVKICQHSWCDLACPSLHLNFPDLIEEVGGLCTPPKIQLLPSNSESLPHYIPQINHGSSRHSILSEQIVVVPLTALVGKNRKGNYDVRFSSADAMRDALMLSRGTEVLVSSIGEDGPIEQFWAEHMHREILSKLSNLSLRGMTVPNFSFMTDVPRVNSLYNLTRIFRLAERMTEAKLPTILHLQASTRSDWKRWADILRDQPQSQCVALEFQTGPRHREVGNKYYCGLVGLLQELGRLHPIVIAGGGRIRDLRRDFPHFTVVDSTPFLKTMKRQKMIFSRDGRWRYHSHPTANGESLSDLLTQNIEAQRSKMYQIAGIGTAFNQRIFQPAA